MHVILYCNPYVKYDVRPSCICVQLVTLFNINDRKCWNDEWMGNAGITNIRQDKSTANDTDTADLVVGLSTLTNNYASWSVCLIFNLLYNLIM